MIYVQIRYQPKSQSLGAKHFCHVLEVLAQGRARNLPKVQRCCRVHWLLWTWGICWLHADYMLITCWLRADYVLITCWLHADYVLITCWLCADYVLITCWLRADYVLITCWLRADYVLIMCWLRADYMLITCWLRADYMLITCWLHADYMLITCWLHADYMLITCWLHADYMLITCWLHADYMLITCWLHADYMLITCWLHADYMLITCWLWLYAEKQHVPKGWHWFFEQSRFAPEGAQRIAPKEREYGALVFVVVRAASHEIYGYGVLRTSTKHGNSSSTQYDMQQANHVFFFGGIYIYDHIDIYIWAYLVGSDAEQQQWRWWWCWWWWWPWRWRHQWSVNEKYMYTSQRGPYSAANMLPPHFFPQSSTNVDHQTSKQNTCTVWYGVPKSMTLKRIKRSSSIFLFSVALDDHVQQ